MRCVTMTGGLEKMTSWFDVKSFDMPRDGKLTHKFFAENYGQQEIKNSAEIIIELIKEEVVRLGSSRHVFLGGFSQGCSTALATWLLYNEGPLGGVVGCSGLYCSNIDLFDIEIKDKKRTPIQLYHGNCDEIYPVKYAAASYKKLEEAGLNHIELEVESMLDHCMSEREAKLISEWIGNIVNREV